MGHNSLKGPDGRRIQETEAQIAQFEETRIAVDAELQTVSLTVQRERERRIQLENVETELRTTLAQAVPERDTVLKLKEKG
eukprot:10274599-Alexandrium_andersonii.AAC.1